MNLDNYANQIVLQAAKIEREYDDAKQRREAAQGILREAKKDFQKFEKAKRDKMRSNERRAAIVGDVALVLGANDAEFWGLVWPHVLDRLSDAADEDRALFELLPRVKSSQGQGEKNDGTPVAKQDGEPEPTTVAAPVDTASDARPNPSDSAGEKREEQGGESS